MTLTPRSSYPSDTDSLIAVFDLRCPKAKERMSREQLGWRGFADVERLGFGHAILIMRPGGALRLAA